MTEKQEQDRALRIVLVEFLPSGGLFQFSFQFGQALAVAGHHVVLLTGPSPELTSVTANLEIIEAFPTWHPTADAQAGTLWRKVRRVARALRLLESWRRTLVHVRRGRPDVVQFGELRFMLDTICFLILARFGHAGALVDVAHNPLPYDVNSRTQSVEKRGRATRRVLAKAYQACDTVFVLGDGPRRDLIANFPRIRRTAVCGHGDYASISGSEVMTPPSAAPPNVLFFGAWTKYKDIPLLLESFHVVRSELPEARLTIAGPVMPDVDFDAITIRARAVGNVDLRPGYVPVQDVSRLFASHRAVVFTYQTVNISGSVHMAYTFGRPVIATDVGSMSDVVVHGVTGLLVRPEPVAVGRAMIDVLGDPQMADWMGAAGARRSDHQSWSRVAERATAAYAQAVQVSIC